MKVFIVEKYLGNTHKNLQSGITNITTDTIHAEIKRWNRYKEAIGQLLVYNKKLPREQLQVYLFDKYKQKSMDEAVDMFKEFNITVFTTKEKVDIIEYDTKNVFYTHIISSNNILRI